MLKFITLMAFIAVAAAASALIWRTLDPAGIARFDAETAAKIPAASTVATPCDAVKEAILDGWGHPPTATFGECSAVPTGTRNYTVAVTLHFPPGIIRQNISYRATVQIDPATGKIRPTDLSHD